jgi:hypothetical protein
MSAEKLHAVTGALDAWEVARVCLWHRINEHLATKGTARLREKRRARAPLPKPPAGVTLAGALSALRIAARALALHLDVTDSFPWLVLGNYPLTLNGSPTAGSIEYELQRLFTGRAAEHADADFWQREIVTPTMKHAEQLRADLNDEKKTALALVELKTPPDSMATKAHISKPGKLILAALLKHFPTLQTIEEICDAIPDKMQLSTRTIGPELKKLIRDGLAYRPDGERKGATLTATGKALAEKLSPS